MSTTNRSWQLNLRIRKKEAPSSKKVTGELFSEPKSDERFGLPDGVEEPCQHFNRVLLIDGPCSNPFRILERIISSISRLRSWGFSRRLRAPIQM